MNYRISKSAYMMDFWVCPCLAVLLVLVSRRSPPFTALLLLCAGLLAWSLAEYAIHRWLFHGRSALAQEHGEHHGRPSEYIGLSGWYTLPGLSGLYGLLWLVMGQAAGPLLLGFVLGYYLYITVHFWFHHRRVAPGSLLFRLKVRHVRHHVGGHENFGVTTPVWDHVFGTFRKR
ncbi:MAG: sterol desaturase family protein [Polaromonas sp.]|nr:sterol desaturase family protein [Polaromonas sp.]